MKLSFRSGYSRSGESISPRNKRCAASGVLRFAARMSVGMVFLIGALGARGARAEDVVAVYSSASPDYTRVKLSNGSFKPEKYAFGEGGDRGGAQKDFTIDRMGFLDV